MNKEKYIIGSISHGTLNPDHLIPRFIDTIEEFDKDRAENLREKWEEMEPDDEDYFLNEELFNILEEYAPPYFYFGAHQGDGSDFGFWLSEEALEDFDGLKVDDLSEIPEDYEGEVLLVNDHGNTTLGYIGEDGEFNEVWAVV